MLGWITLFGKVNKNDPLFKVELFSELTVRTDQLDYLSLVKVDKEKSCGKFLLFQKELLCHCLVIIKEIK
jgi:hypothetical protein